MRDYRLKILDTDGDMQALLHGKVVKVPSVNSNSRMYWLLQNFCQRIDMLDITASEGERIPSPFPFVTFCVKLVKLTRLFSQ